ncbi:hypothetical protein SRHO_G00239680 [Serrasalmus rhombeus]
MLEALHVSRLMLALVMLNPPNEDEPSGSHGGRYSSIVVLVSPYCTSKPLRNQVQAEVLYGFLLVKPQNAKAAVGSGIVRQMANGKKGAAIFWREKASQQWWRPFCLRLCQPDALRRQQQDNGGQIGIANP